MTEPSTRENEPTPGRVSRAYRSARETVQARDEKLDAARKRWPPIDILFAAYERDREVNGNVFAGAVAFRLFLWMLPMTLVVVAGLGFLQASDVDPEGALKNVGISRLSADSIAESLSRSSTSRWWALLVGLVGVYLASIALAKVVYRTSALAWRMPEARLRSHPRVAGAVVALTGIVLVMTGIAARAPSLSGIDWLARLGLLALYGAAWFGAAYLLPHRDASPRALLPGAVLVAVGAEALHLFTVVYIVRKLNSASELYGSLGTAFVILFWLYLLGRLIVAASVLNAILWERRTAAG
jgi:uncharacterized BrkB/YihY/UPF0761 family membrane protein